jgi:hypothetical protein
MQCHEHAFSASRAAANLTQWQSDVVAILYLDSHDAETDVVSNLEERSENTRVAPGGSDSNIQETQLKFKCQDKIRATNKFIYF